MFFFNYIELNQEEYFGYQLLLLRVNSKKKEYFYLFNMDIMKFIIYKYIKNYLSYEILFDLWFI